MKKKLFLFILKIFSMIGAALGMANTAMSMATSIKQLLDSKNIDTKRPEKKLTDAFLESERMARSQYNSPMFRGQSPMEQQIGVNAANQLKNISNTAGSGSEALLAAGMANNTMQNGLIQTGIQNANRKYQDYVNMINMLGNKNTEMKDIWDYNVNQPYERRVAQQQAEHQAGMTNMSNALKDVGNIGAMADAGMAAKKQDATQKKMFEKIFGSLDGGTTSSTMDPSIGINMMQYFKRKPF